MGKINENTIQRIVLDLPDYQMPITADATNEEVIQAVMMGYTEQIPVVKAEDDASYQFTFLQHMDVNFTTKASLSDGGISVPPVVYVTPDHQWCKDKTCQSFFAHDCERCSVTNIKALTRSVKNFQNNLHKLRSIKGQGK